MLYLANVFKTVYYTFDNTSFSQHNFIIHAHEGVFHIAFNFCYKLYPIIKKLFKKGMFYKVSFVCVKFTKDVSTEIKQQILIIIRYIAGSKFKADYLCLIINYQMKLKSEKPAGRTKTTFRNIFKLAVLSYTLIFATASFVESIKDTPVQFPMQ